MKKFNLLMVVVMALTSIVSCRSDEANNPIYGTWHLKKLAMEIDGQKPNYFPLDANAMKSNVQINNSTGRNVRIEFYRSSNELQFGEGEYIKDLGKIIIYGKDRNDTYLVELNKDTLNLISKSDNVSTKFKYTK